MWQKKGQLVLNTTGRRPAGWDVSEVSPVAAAVGLGRSVVSITPLGLVDGSQG